jgi:hypothetical protein
METSEVLGSPTWSYDDGVVEYDRIIRGKCGDTPRRRPWEERV